MSNIFKKWLYNKIKMLKHLTIVILFLFSISCSIHESEDQSIKVNHINPIAQSFSEKYLKNNSNGAASKAKERTNNLYNSNKKNVRKKPKNYYTGTLNYNLQGKHNIVPPQQPKSNFLSPQQFNNYDSTKIKKNNSYKPSEFYPLYYD